MEKDQSKQALMNEQEEKEGRKNTPFSAMNFPYEGNEDFKGAGSRTMWAGEGKHRVRQDTALIRDDGKMALLMAGSEVTFLSPYKLFRGAEVGASQRTARSIYAAAGVEGMGKGYVMISHVKKPRGIVQKRVTLGASAQEKIMDILMFNSQQDQVELEKISEAPPGSKNPDLVVSYGDGTVQFEIKGRNHKRGPIVLIDKSVRRGQKIDLIEAIIQAYLDSVVVRYLDDGEEKEENLRKAVKALGYEESFEGIIDFYKNHIDSSVGFCEDKGDVPKSGRLPSIFRTNDPRVLKKARDQILEYFQQSEDDYLAVYTRTDEEVDIYSTGTGNNPLGAIEMPALQYAELNTYGGCSRGATRVGIKISLKPEESNVPEPKEEKMSVLVASENQQMKKDQLKQLLMEHLLLEGRIDDARRKYPELDETGALDIFIDNDPEGKQKYLMGAARLLDGWLNTSRFAPRKDAGEEQRKYAISRAAGDFAENIKTYHQAIKRNIITGKESDINYFKGDYKEFFSVMNDAEKKIKEKDKQKQLVAAAKEGTDFLYKDNLFLLVRPKTVGSSCYFGQGSKWCISATESENYFDEYTGKGKVFFMLMNRLMPNDNKWHKVAFEWNSHPPNAEQIWDAEDVSHPTRVGFDNMLKAYIDELEVKGWYDEGGAMEGWTEEQEEDWKDQMWNEFYNLMAENVEDEPTGVSIDAIEEIVAGYSLENTDVNVEERRGGDSIATIQAYYGAGLPDIPAHLEWASDDENPLEDEEFCEGVGEVLEGVVQDEFYPDSSYSDDFCEKMGVSFADFHRFEDIEMLHDFMRELEKNDKWISEEFPEAAIDKLLARGLLTKRDFSHEGEAPLPSDKQLELPLKEQIREIIQQVIVEEERSECLKLKTWEGKADCLRRKGVEDPDAYLGRLKADGTID